jgi:NAD-dependent dihydropyrimidine dehydrogenase PreA subunit
LRRVGNPDENSPVLVSGNYTLTVHRLLRVLRGFDCWLLVANSRGSNVWCAAGMNEYSEHDIIDAVNVAELSSVVKHKRIIAPPYAAPGVDVNVVKEQTGFRLIWGPTHLNDIPRYLTNLARRTYDMGLVQFGFQDRMEQALSTALAYCLTIAIAAIFWPKYIFGAMGIVFFVYCFGFAMWNFLPTERAWRRTITVALLLGVPWGAFMAWRGWSIPEMAIWEGIVVAVVLLMAMDGCGSSAVYKSTVAHWVKKGDYHSSFSPIIDPNMCTNCMDCQVVCPTDVFARRREGEHRMVVVRPENCIECLACVKQCDDEAIFNRSGKIKGDVKSIENLDLLMTRDWSHIADEDRWIGMPTAPINGYSVVAEGKLLTPNGNGKSNGQATGAGQPVPAEGQLHAAGTGDAE